MDAVSTGSAEDPEALLNAWLGELDNLTMVCDCLKMGSV